MTEIQTNSPGQVKISDEVIAVIAGTALHEVDGVIGVAGHGEAGGTTYAIPVLSDLLNKKNMAKGVNVTIEEGQVYVAAEITVRFGVKVQEVGRDVQERVKNAIETMTGLTVAEVNVNVAAVVHDKHKANA